MSKKISSSGNGNWLRLFIAEAWAFYSPFCLYVDADDLKKFYAIFIRCGIMDFSKKPKDEALIHKVFLEGLKEAAEFVHKLGANRECNTEIRLPVHSSTLEEVILQISPSPLRLAKHEALARLDNLLICEKLLLFYGDLLALSNDVLITELDLTGKMNDGHITGVESTESCSSSDFEEPNSSWLEDKENDPNFDNLLASNQTHQPHSRRCTSSLCLHMDFLSLTSD